MCVQSGSLETIVSLNQFNLSWEVERAWYITERPPSSPESTRISATSKQLQQQALWTKQTEFSREELFARTSIAQHPTASSSFFKDEEKIIVWKVMIHINQHVNVKRNNHLQNVAMQPCWVNTYSMQQERKRQIIISYSIAVVRV